MNATQFNTELRKVIDRGIKEGVFDGKMSAPEFIGIIEFFKHQSLLIIHRQIAEQEAAKKPVILRPPNGFEPR